MSEPRLYLYRKAGREVWDAEMWLPDGRRRVWRTGIADKSEAIAAARARLKGLAAVQPVAHIEGGCTADEGAPAASAEACARDVVSMREQEESDAPASADERPQAQVEGAEIGAVPASEKRAQELQTQEKAREMGSLGRFDRWFFGDLASLWRARA